MSEQTVELRLTPVALRALAEHDLLPGWPGEVDPGVVFADDPRFALKVASARWYSRSRTLQVGRERIQLGGVPPEGAARILAFLEAIARGMLTPEVTDRATREEGHALGRCVDFAVEHMERRGVTVQYEGSTGLYRIEV